MSLEAAERIDPRDHFHRFFEGGGRKYPTSSSVADSQTDPEAAYLREMGQHPLLSAQEKLRHFKVYQDGLAAEKRLQEYREHNQAINPLSERPFLEKIQQGERAKQELIESNLRLVVAIAKRYKNKMPLLDCIQEGNLGLIKAVEKFDWQRGFKFSTYATWWIRQAIQRAIVDKGSTIRLPAFLHEELSAYKKADGELGQEASMEELSERLGFTQVHIQQLIESSQFVPQSLDKPSGDDQTFSLKDTLADKEASIPEQVERTLLKEELANFLQAKLTDRELVVIRRRFGLDDDKIWTLEEVGNQFGLTKERIRQIEATALRKLRRSSSAQKALEQYLN